MIQCEMKSTVSAYSDPCRETSLIEAGIYSSLRFPDIRLTRVEQDASCSKYLNKPFKKQRPRFRPARYSSGATLSSESDSSSDESCSSEYIVSDDGSISSDDSISKASRIKINRINDQLCSKTQSTKTSWNLGESTKSLGLNSTDCSKFLKFPIIKLIRLENDENCYKYVNKNLRTEMPGRTTDKKKLNPIVIVSNQNVHGKHKTSFMIKKHTEYEEPSNFSEESKDSCYYTSINDSDCSHNSVSDREKINRFNLNFSSGKPPNHLSKECSISLTPLEINYKNLQVTNSRKSSHSSELTPVEIDLTSEDSSSSVEEQLVVGHRENRVGSTESNSNFSETVISEDESSTSDEIMRCFEPEASENSESNSNSTFLEETNSTPTTNVAESENVKVYDSGIGITDDTTSEDSYYIKSTVVIPNHDNSDGSDQEECFIVDLQFIDDDDFERLVFETSKSASDKPLEATCDLCKDSFTSRPSLYRHMEQRHNCSDIFECAHCGQIFSVKACLVYHLYAQLSEDFEKVSDTHACSQYSYSKDAFTNSELEFLSSFCSNHAMLHSHLIKSETIDQNQNCTLTVSEITSNGESSAEELCSPGIRKNKFTNSALTSVDENSKHGRLKRKSTTRGRIPEKNRKCNRQTPSEHMCHLCKEECKSKEKLLSHFANNHCHICYHECHACEKLFQNSICLATHYARKECPHIIKKPQSSIKCDICNAVYKSKSILRKHKMNLHNVFAPQLYNPLVQNLTKLPSSETLLNCTFCYNSYSSSLDLLDHERVSHNYYSCFQPFCSEKFFSRGDLERHLFLHFAPGESSFCGFCSKLFFTKQYLEKHIKKHLLSPDAKIVTEVLSVD